MSKPKITILEAAELAGVSDRTIRTWIASGILPAYRYGPRVVRIDPDDLDNMGQRIPTRAAEIAPVKVRKPTPEEIAREKRRAEYEALKAEFDTPDA